LDACAAPATRNLFQFAIATGLRTGELIALRWSDIDFDQRKCNVQRSIVEDYEKDTKTPKGNRAVDLSDEALEALINQRTISKKRSSVFCNPRTLLPLYNSGEIHWLWHKAVRKAEIKYRSPYQTRHTYASTKITDGCNLWELADQMGHVGTEMLNRHYGFWIEANTKAAREQAHKDEKLEASAKEIEESDTVA
jgi:integrase